ncbi:hypothetical protein A6M27_20015 [Acidithiobacillus thiooxidans]|uniref:Uncharacterized protein n=1 Tax=Acidithiobacillus thiooxidans TaxID=930 RepID=A0A1C2IYS6_ACITH|nr:hypothetical protein [Acidithiobacillus thiooxidans]OCX73320.1 hypothetical protein A6O24_11700 [Acidithiobacillus thiooxidans]OCX77315.1 hypothetical protein A6P07_00410 [Acidithiobacillus thiooxidans]OCX78047.1 hypothetical protein A6O26_18635 [Acidithiobacillus thiooxidans]OCX81138.1 hypothetical protein A6M27_20015 [Acidithiobacillus thiooxidans]OFC41099.1 hypothetical protein BAE47_18760 [Acidithiobacillus thiooxidans]
MKVLDRVLARKFTDRVFEIATVDMVAALGEVVADRVGGHRQYEEYLTEYLTTYSRWLKELNAEDHKYLYDAAVAYMRDHSGFYVKAGLTRVPSVSENSVLMLTPPPFVHQTFEGSTYTSLESLLPVLVDRIERIDPNANPYEDLRAVAASALKAYGDWLESHLGGEEGREHFIAWTLGKAAEVAFMKGTRTEAKKLLPTEK